MTKYILTVCIVHYRKINKLKKTIHFLELNTKTPFLLKIYNNGYIDKETKIYFKNISKKINTQIIYGKKNIGCSPARNHLVKKTTTPYIMILDDDIYVSKNWDVEIFKKFKKDKRVGVLGFSIYKKNGEFWFYGGQKISIKNKTIFLNRPRYQIKNKKFIKVDDVSAGAMVLRREMLNYLEWDKKYFIGFEDLEQGLQIKRSPYIALILTRSQFIHDKVSENKRYIEYNKYRRNYHQLRNSYIYFMEKNNLKLEFKRHFFYKYFCLLPNSFLKNIVFMYFKFNS